MSTVGWKIVQLIFSNCFHGEKTTVGIKTCKKSENVNFYVNKRLKEAKVKFLIEHDKKEFK